MIVKMYKPHPINVVQNARNLRDQCGLNYFITQIKPAILKCENKSHKSNAMYKSDAIDTKNEKYICGFIGKIIFYFSSILFSN